MDDNQRETFGDQVPDDFPKFAGIPGAVSGAKPKVVLARYEGRYYPEGFTPPERLARWKEYEELAHFFVEKCLRNEHGKYAGLTREEILAQYLRRLNKHRHGTAEECRWMIRRTAVLLNWPVPETALEKSANSANRSN